MSDAPINAWILDPVTSAIAFVAEEAKIVGLLQRALTHIEGGRPLLELAARHLAATHNRKAVGAIRSLLSEAPIQEKWAAELRSDDYALLNGHSLVAIWGALEAGIEDTVVGILAKDRNAPNILMQTGVRLPQVYPAPADDEELRKLYRKAEDKVRVKHDVVDTQENLLQLFGLTASCPGRKDTLLSANSIRNALVHRSGFIDTKAVQQAPMLSSMLGQKIRVTRDLYLQCHEAVSQTLVMLIGSIASSKYMVANGGE